MKNVKYVSPKFDFQELKLLERVSDTCFGNKVVWLDLDGNGKGGANEPQIPMTGCGGKEAAEALNKATDVDNSCQVWLLQPSTLSRLLKNVEK